MATEPRNHRPQYPFASGSSNCHRKGRPIAWLRQWDLGILGISFEGRFLGPELWGSCFLLSITLIFLPALGKCRQSSHQAMGSKGWRKHFPDSLACLGAEIGSSSSIPALLAYCEQFPCSEPRRAGQPLPHHSSVA